MGKQLVNKKNRIPSNQSAPIAVYISFDIIKIILATLYRCQNIIYWEGWPPVLVVEEAGVPGENHRPWASNW
jgi:hypothetical protein